MKKSTSDRFKNKIPIVFVPALMGTNLQKRVGKESPTVYVTGAIGLGLNTPDLALPIQWDFYIGHNASSKNELPRQRKDNIHPSGPLGDIKLNLPFCCRSVKVMEQYTMFCEYFQRFEHFYTFGYDWRRDLNETTDILLEFLKNIKQKHGFPAQVVSHSMGCLISLAACNTNPSLFHSSCFVGGMFAGGVGFYPMNTIGMPVGINQKYLAPRVLHTFPSMFATASPMGVENDPNLKDEHGTQLWRYVDANDTTEVIHIDMYDINHWKKYKIGPWRLKGQVSNEMEQHIENCLYLGYKFQLKLRRLEKQSGSLIQKQSLNVSTYPPTAVLVGDNFSHPEYFLWDKEHNRSLDWTPKLIKRYEPKHAKTDGTISYISASRPSIPEGVKILEFKARNDKLVHRELMNDPEMVESILQYMREEATKE